jgi:type IV pilus assembly protein PilF
MRQRRFVLAVAALLMAAVAGTTATAAQPARNLEQAAAANTELALAYMREGNLAASRDKIEKALTQYSRTARTQMAAGIIYDRLNNRRKAQTHFEQAIKLGKDDPDVLNNAAVYLCRYGDYKRGEQFLLQAAESPLNRTPDVAYTNAGRCARANERPQDAEQYFRRALAVNPKQADALLQMAELALAANNGLQARAFLERYNAVATPTPATLMLGRRIEMVLGDASQAQRYAQRIKEEFPMSAEAGQLFDEEHATP